MPNLGKISRRDQRRTLNESKTVNQSSKKEIIPGLKMLEKMKEKKAAQKLANLSCKEKTNAATVVNNAMPNKRKSIAANGDNRSDNVTIVKQTGTPVKDKSYKKAQPLATPAMIEKASKLAVGNANEKIPGLILMDIIKEKDMVLPITKETVVEKPGVKRQQSAKPLTSKKPKRLVDNVDIENYKEFSDISDVSEASSVAKKTIQKSQSLKMTKTSEVDVAESKTSKRSTRKSKATEISKSLKEVAPVGTPKKQTRKSEIVKEDARVESPKRRSRKSTYFPVDEDSDIAEINPDNKSKVDEKKVDVAAVGTPKRRSRKSTYFAVDEESDASEVNTFIKSKLVEEKVDVAAVGTPKRRSRKSTNFAVDEESDASEVNTDNKSKLVEEKVDVAAVGTPKRRSRKSIFAESDKTDIPQSGETKKRSRMSLSAKELTDEASSPTSVTSETSDTSKPPTAKRARKSKKLLVIPEEKPAPIKMEDDETIEEIKTSNLKRKGAVRSLKDIKKSKVETEPITDSSNAVNTISSVNVAEKTYKPTNSKIPGLALLEEAKKRKSLNTASKKPTKDLSPQRKRENQIIPGLKDLKQDDDCEPKSVIIKELDISKEIKVTKIPGLVSPMKSPVSIQDTKSICKIPGLKTYSPVKSIESKDSSPSDNLAILDSFKSSKPNTPTFSSIMASRKECESDENSSFTAMKRTSLFQVSNQQDEQEPMNVSTNVVMSDGSPILDRNRSAPCSPFDSLSKHKRIVSRGVYNSQFLTPNPILKRRPSIYTSTPGISPETREMISKRPNVSFHGMVEVKEFMGNSFNSSDEDSFSNSVNAPVDNYGATSSKSSSGAMKFKKAEPAGATSESFRNFLLANKKVLKEKIPDEPLPTRRNDTEDMEVSYTYGQSEDMADISSDNNDSKDGSKCNIM